MFADSRFAPMALAILVCLSTGCSLKINNDLDSKADIPLSECSLDADCDGVNEACVEQSDGISTWDECNCAYGFERGSSGDCSTWAGLITGGEFRDAATWTLNGDLQINTSAPGSSGPGVLEISTTGLCELAKASQIIANTSTLDGTGPLVVEVTGRVGPRSGSVPAGIGIQVGVGVGGHWTTVKMTESWDTTRFCVGEANFGEAMNFSIGGMAHIDTNDGFACSNTPLSNAYEVEISDVDIFPSNPDECPEPGALPSPQFLTADGWTETEQLGNGTSGIEPDAGKDGTSAMVLEVAAGTGRIAIGTPVLFPKDRSVAQALSFWMRGTGGVPLDVRAGGYTLATVVGNGLPRDITICLPGYLNGVGQELSIGSPPGQDWPVARIELDDIAIHSDERCADSVGVLNGGFELNDETPTYEPKPASYDFGPGLITGGPVVNPDTSYFFARSGAASFAIDATYANACLCATGDCDAAVDSCAQAFESPRFLASGSVASEEAGPALSLWYLTDNIERFRLRTSLDGPNDWVPFSSGWQRHTVCLPARAEGRAVPVQLVFNPLPEQDQALMEPDTVHIDDLEVFMDPNCASAP